MSKSKLMLAVGAVLAVLCVSQPARAWNLGITSAIVQDKQEMELRTEIRDLRHDLIYYQAVNAAKLTDEQARKLLPIAIKARERILQRNDEFLKAVAPLIVDMESLRDHLIDPSKGKGWNWDNGGVYRWGDIAGWAKDMKALGDQAAEIFDDAQKKAFLKVSNDNMWFGAPVNYDGIGCKDTFMPFLLMSPCAVSDLQKRCGQDTKESLAIRRKLVEANAASWQIRNYAVAGLHHRVVPAVNLFNGLNFTDEQLKQLMEISKAAGELNKAHSQEIQKSCRALIAALQKACELAADGKGGPKELQKEIADASAGVCGMGYINFCKVHGDFTKGMKELAEKTVAVIGPERAGLSVGVNTCFLPPDYAAYSDPVRVGEIYVEERLPEQNLLDQLRKLPKDEFAAARDKAVSDRLDAIKKQAGDKFDPKTADAQRAKLAEVLDCARAASDAVYTLDGRSLAAQFGGKVEPRGNRNAGRIDWSKTASDTEVGRDHGLWPFTKEERILYFYLDAEFVPIFQKYRDVLANAKAVEAKDLDKLAGAEVHGEKKP